jgi:hypothetical protein
MTIPQTQTSQCCRVYTRLAVKWSFVLEIYSVSKRNSGVNAAHCELLSKDDLFYSGLSPGFGSLHAVITMLFHASLNLHIYKKIPKSVAASLSSKMEMQVALWNLNVLSLGYRLKIPFKPSLSTLSTLSLSNPFPSYPGQFIYYRFNKLIVMLIYYKNKKENICYPVYLSLQKTFVRPAVFVHQDIVPKSEVYACI